MPSINMIAARRSEKRRQEQNTRRLIYGILAEFGVILLVISVMVTRIVTTYNHIADLDDQIKSLQTKVDEIKHLQTATQALQPKIAALEQAKNGTLYWYTAIGNVASSLPDDAWLANVSASGSPTGTDPGAQAKLNVNGTAKSQFAVGTTMLRMNAYPTIDQVSLNNVTQNNDPTSPGVNFQLVVQLKPLPSPKTSGGSDVQKS
ncbi:MAG: PilN domain-containing protein [Capsulimonadaceae bacterium]|nr:PilN domain-containing protein [Capsulimonadaceae bacterium]